MRAQLMFSSLILSGSAYGFSDSSPWVVLSSSSLPKAPSHQQMQTSSEVIEHAKNILKDCNSDRYLIVTHPGANAADLTGAGSCSLPHFREAVENTPAKEKFSVAEVIGDVTGANFADFIKSSCVKRNKEATVEEVRLDAASPRSERINLKNDKTVIQALKAARQQGSYTVLFFGVPREPIYEPEFNDPLHMETKRQAGYMNSQQNANGTRGDSRSLFEKYQFFTPGIFMGIIVALILFAILFVGIRGLASLEVSYGAFEKEMGPAAQRKQQ